MDKRTRVLNAMNKKPVDHVPVGFWFHFSGDEMYGERCVQAHLDYYRDCDLDFLKVMSDGYFPYPVAKDAIKSAADLKALRPVGKDHPWIKEQVERAKAIVKQIGSERCVFYNLFTPFTSFRFGITEPAAMQYAKTDKNALKHALDVAAWDAATLGELLITEAGCDGVYYCVQNAEFDRFTEEEYKDIVAPCDMFVLEHINRFSDNNILHCCGFFSRPNRISLWRDYPAKCVNWATHVENVDLNEGRHFFGNRAILGGFDTHWELHNPEGQRGIIYHGTKEEVQQYTRDLILNTGKLGLLIGGDCTVDARINTEHVKWIVEAARSV